MKSFLRNNWLVMAVAFVVAVLFMTSCKKTYGEPPETGAPDIVANTTIKALKARDTVQGSVILIMDDVIIEGVVNMDDRSGNYYQQISIQDSTGGIILRLAGSNLNTSYPVGRKVYIKAKGLYIGDYGKMIQLGGGADSIQGGVTLLTANLQDQHIIKGAINQTLTPKVVTISQLGTSMQDPYINTLIKLQDVEFSSSDLSKNYADADASGNRTVQGCVSPATNKITLRTSNYANFANLPVAQGNGELVGIYSLFNTTKQFTIRDTTDVRFYGARCPTPAGNGAITLGTSPLTFNFDDLGSAGLPAGIYVKQDATATDLGFDATVYNGNFSTPTAWNQSSLGFKNVASANGLTSTATSTQQSAATNRALGLRQTSTVSTGGDPGAAFVFRLANTSGKSNLQMEFKLQSLDAPTTAGRTATWKVDYGVGANPTAFTTVTTNPATLTTTNGTFSNTTVTVNFGSILNNINQPIWIRIVTLTGTSGGGNRPTSAIDDVKFSWN